MHHEVKQILLGSILGKTFINHYKGSYYFCIRQGKRHLSWLQTKTTELSCISSDKGIYWSSGAYSWRSLSLPIVEEFYKKCYVNGKKKVTMSWLDELCDLGIAVWFGDSAGVRGRDDKNIYLRTQKYSIEEVETIQKYFSEVGFSCNINISKSKHIILFDVNGSKKILNLICDYLPKSREFLFGKKLSNN